MLGAELTGHVVLPDDPDYDCARMVFNTRFSKFPKVIIYCRSTRDVANAICWAREHDVPLRSRCGGHSYEAFSVANNSIVIDISCMNNICVDPCKQLAKIEAGNTLLPLYEKLSNYGVTIPGGTCPGVGIAGLTLGGGFGMHTRLWGMTCDNLLALEMVDAKGKIIHADPYNNADLFWASCGGGGGNFGIVTSFTFHVHPISDVSIFEITWKWDEILEVVDTWQQWAPFTDDRLTSTLKLFTREKEKIIAAGEFVGSKEELIRLLQPLFITGKPITIEVKTVPFITAAYRWAGFPGDPCRWPRSPVPFKNTGSFAYNRLPPQALNVIVNYLSTSPSKENWLTLHALGGVVARVPPSATAYVHRQALFAFLFDSFPQCKQDEQENIRWVTAFRNSMLPYSNGGYVNFSDCCIKDWLSAYYGCNFTRLMQIKQKYDPENVFHFPQSIPPLN
jgi:FAD/FMN-containing dehydrogenase